MYDIPSTLANNLKYLREKARLTQDELSDKAGVAYSTIAKLEQGAIKNPTLTTIWSITQVLDVSVDDLLSNNLIVAETNDDKAEIKFVYFDVNDVLVRFYHRAFSVIANKTGQPIDKIESIFWHFNTAANRGDISMAEFNKRIGAKIGDTNFDWQKYYMGEVESNKQVTGLLRQLKKHYKVGLLTNMFPGGLNSLIEKGKLPKIKYDAVIDSTEVNTVKPDTKIYEIAQEESGVKPGEILFIDNSRENLTTATNLGWRVVWFDAYHPNESIARIKDILDK